MDGPLKVLILDQKIETPQPNWHLCLRAGVSDAFCARTSNSFSAVRSSENLVGRKGLLKKIVSESVKKSGGASDPLAPFFGGPKLYSTLQQ